ncbi:MAG: hypothetical protein O3C40_27045 [Planctomycetota bacterium]|nr:hypothetical protein [Planctomycetota bacterium]
MEELKKQLVLGYFNSGRFDWDSARDALDQRRELVETCRSIGFASNQTASTETSVAASADDGTGERLLCE